MPANQANKRMSQFARFVSDEIRSAVP
jgi:hypothetical protein